MVLFLFVRTFILRSENSFQRGLYFMPFCYFFTLAFNIFFIVYKGSGGGFVDLSKIPWWGTVLISVGTGLAVGVLVAAFLPKFKKIAIERYEKKLREEDEERKTKIDSDSDDENVKNDLKNAAYSLSDSESEKEKIIKVAFKPEEFDPKTEELFSFLQILTACFESFAHGSNDVANAIGSFFFLLIIHPSFFYYFLFIY